jgi:hypothetical protein
MPLLVTCSELRRTKNKLDANLVSFFYRKRQQSGKTMSKLMDWQQMVCWSCIRRVCFVVAPPSVAYGVRLRLAAMCLGCENRGRRNKKASQWVKRTVERKWHETWNDNFYFLDLRRDKCFGRWHPHRFVWCDASMAVGWGVATLTCASQTVRSQRRITWSNSFCSFPDKTRSREISRRNQCRPTPVSGWLEHLSHTQEGDYPGRTCQPTLRLSELRSCSRWVIKT